jgi:oligopeptide/dipeptide ABC transporter ATP-binding protein
MNAPNVLCSVTQLEKRYPVRRGLLRRDKGWVRAVDGVSFDVFERETLALVGESGSGKSTTGRAILHLDPPTAGSVRYRGVDLGALSPAELRRTRREMQMIFQDPFSSLNPRMQVGSAVREPLDVHGIGEPAERQARVAELFEQVGLGAELMDRYPHEFSGGQRQRVGIARALATEPAFIVADEPISALDVSIQAQIVNLLQDLKASLGLTYLLIAHDLSMVRHVSDRVAVMYLGKLVELGPTQSVFSNPAHPYTKALVSAIPVPDPASAARRALPVLKGEIPDPADPPGACPFHPRCPEVTDLCRTTNPEWSTVEMSGGFHGVACHHAEAAP